MKLRKGFWIYFPVALFAWLSPVSVSSVSAESFTTTGAQDYFFTLEQPQLFTVRTFAQQYGIDSMLWLYDSDNIAISANDDWFGLDSYISMNLNAGTYRLRTGVCCGDPNRWYGTSYVIDVNIAPSNAPSTTTTESTTTTSSSTTTSSVPQTTLPESTTTTTLPPETSTSTTEPQTTTTSSTSTTVPETSTTTTVTPTSTTTTTSSTLPPVPEPPVVVPTGTTTTTVEETTTTTTLPEETTTTTEPEPETTVPETTTTETYPDTTVAEVTTTTLEPNLEPNLEPLTEEEITAVVEELTTITEVTPEVLSQVVDALNSDNITEEQVQAIVDAVVENLDTLTEITPEVLDEVLNVLESDNITQEQVQEVVDTILATNISSDQATQLATSAAVLESITGDQATEVFASIDTGELSGEEAAAIVEALLEAPTEVKEAFEAEINVFEGGFDEYVPTDSTISVGARRVVVAATTVSFILPAPVVSRRQSKV